MRELKTAVTAVEKAMETLSDLLKPFKDEKLGFPVLISKLHPGETFKTDIGTFIVLEQTDEGTKVITKDLYKKNVRFGDSTNYKESKVLELCDGDIYADFCEVFGEENIITHKVDLTTVDMQKPYGTVECDVRVLTFDEARKYNHLLVNKELPDCWWTCTPWSTKERGWEYSVAVVSPSGHFYDDDFNGVYGVRPFCILKSDIFVSLVKED